MQVGDVVIPAKHCTNVLHCGTGRYTHAIVAQLNPFIIISDDGSMKWSKNWEPHNMIALCQASEKIQNVVQKRLKSGV